MAIGWFRLNGSIITRILVQSLGSMKKTRLSYSWIKGLYKFIKSFKVRQYYRRSTRTTDSRLVFRTADTTVPSARRIFSVPLSANITEVAFASTGHMVTPLCSLDSCAAVRTGLPAWFREYVSIRLGCESLYDTISMRGLDDY